MVLRCARDTVIAVLLSVTTALAQDVRGLEVCTAEKDMTRRTGCLQANVEYLQQELVKLTRRATAEGTAAAKENAALKADVAMMKTDLAAVKDALVKAQSEIAELKKARPAEKK
jgi:hypothetical protein